MMYDVKGTPNADDEKDTPAWVAASSASELTDTHDIEIDCGGAFAEEDTPASYGLSDDELEGEGDDVEGTPNADDEKDTPAWVEVEFTRRPLQKPKKKQETAAASSAKHAFAEEDTPASYGLSDDELEGEGDDVEGTPNADDEKDTPAWVEVEFTRRPLQKPKKKQETAAASSAKHTTAERRRAQREQLDLDLDSEEGDDDDEEDTPNAVHDNGPTSLNLGVMCHCPADEAEWHMPSQV